MKTLQKIEDIHSGHYVDPFSENVYEVKHIDFKLGAIQFLFEEDNNNSDADLSIQIRTENESVFSTEHNKYVEYRYWIGTELIQSILERLKFVGINRILIDMGSIQKNGTIFSRSHYFNTN